MTSYGQFCPVAKAMEILDERWTILVVRELIAGSTHFNELRRGNPKMSPALLSRRLRTLERVGVVVRHEEDGKVTYNLTRAGRELEPIVNALGSWGTRWIGQLGDEDYDPHLLMWDMRRNIPIENWPRTRTVVAFEVGGVASDVSRWWLVVNDGEADVCDFDPGFEPAVTVAGSLRALVEVWRADTTWERALASGKLSLDGPSTSRRALPRWIGQSPMISAYERVS